MEFVLAYGCGKWRSVAADQEWKRDGQAHAGTARALEPAVKEAERWLRSWWVGEQC